ncbi:GntR family transcriptional regulator [Clostridium sp. SYSU_GA19001]|uniref:GntR family transcriptional regulator n=1 Tax=Clostridium caldaquaticum TaxID=2940653 RepID=UPI0020773D33|nr:GntR family transcriptional regulator [Clostridium caldaquaticum]MCM8711227.1 GntR family transcriptional regulator [Clostridium caldaquaticum]
MAAIVKQSLVDQIYEHLREKIINLEIEWGERVNVNELQEKLGISCTPIREAINRLQKEGLIEYKNNIGARVINFTEKDILEVQEVAFTLDCAAITYAMKSANGEDIAKKLLEQINLYKAAKNEVERSRCVEKFIYVFYEYANNSRLISVSQLIKVQQSMLRSAYRKQKKDSSNMEEHIRIYNAVLSGDIEGAIKALRENYDKGTEILMSIINNK